MPSRGGQPAGGFSTGIRALDAYSGAVIGALERVAPAVTFIEVEHHAAQSARGKRRARAAAVRVSFSRPMATS